MRSATLHIHGSANDLLPPHRRDRSFPVEFELPIGLRDLIQATGIPWVELRAVSVNGEPARPATRIDDGDVIEAHSRYPVAEPPADPRFVLDVHLGRLAHYLRLFGFDTAHRQEADDRELVDQSLAESRILLTRDRGLLMWGTLVDGCFVRATDPRRQITEVIERFALASVGTPLSRCLACNGSLQELSAAEAAPLIPDSVAESHTEFTTCPDCGRVYWKGSHYRRLLAIIEQVGARQ
jgi:uncharacterized protein with PIN domain